MRITIRVDDRHRDDIRSACAIVVESGRKWSQRLEPCDQGLEAELRFADTPHVAYYRFEIELAQGGVLELRPSRDARSTAGELYHGRCESDAMFQVTIYERGFSTPQWFSGAIMYQAFPDRFARGSSGVNEEGMRAHEARNRPVRLQTDWNTPLSWDRVQEYDPLEFYGGTFEGIREKLPYLASLGVEALYLNPVFEARSNHRYDTADYENVDPLLGTNADFEALAGEADAFGISIVLDAVLSHTGADSRYFNATGAYEEPGAMQGNESPYRAWYEFSGGERHSSYRCWWGDPSLPEVDERNPSWQHYILGDILPRWLRAGAKGYRFDVADEVPDDVLHYIREAVKGANPNAVMIGEVWEDATTKVSYGEERTYALGTSLDSVMNYPLRDALLGFALGSTDAHQLATFIKLQQSNYPKPLYCCLMNILSTHDVERIRTVLALGGPIKDLPRLEQCKRVMSISPEADEEAARLQAMLAGIVYALPGSPCIYYGDERGMQGGGDPFCRAPMVWGEAADRSDCGLDLTDYYRELGATRKRSAALRDGDMRCVALDSDAVCIVRFVEDGPACALALANRASRSRLIAVDLKALGVWPLGDESLASCSGVESCEDGILTARVVGKSTLLIVP